MKQKTINMKKSFFLMLALLSCAFWSTAQNNITGKIMDGKTGQPLSGVTILVNGTNKAAQSQADGSFTLDAASNSGRLTISYVGYDSRTVSFTAGKSVDVKLSATEKKLDDVVIVAYGSRKKSDLTGAVTQITAKEFQKGNIVSSEQLLQGKVAGLEVTTGGGSAGGGSKLRIRGGASLNASNDPLLVVDGVPVESNGIAGSSNYLNTINPDDIESVSVLKDASATALYGSRASNGVIIITTKKGTKGKLKVNFNTQLSNSMINKNRYVDVLSGDEIRDIVNADAAATGNNAYKNVLGTSNTDWQNQIYQSAFGNNTNVSASGSLNPTKGMSLPFRLSMGYSNQEGVLKTDKFSRFSTALNLAPKFLDDHLSVNLNVKFASTSKRFADEGAIGSAVSFDPTQPVFTSNTKYGGYTEWLQADGKPIDLATRNPLALLELRNNKSVVNRLVGNVQLDYKLHFLPDLHLQANLGLDNASGSGDDVVDSTSATNYRTLGRKSHYEQKKKNYLADLSLFYTKNLPSANSKLDVLFTHSYQDFITEVSNFASFGQNDSLIPGSTPTFASDRPQYRLESYIGRVNYSYNDRYLVTLSMRRDASSKFSRDNRVGYFPAAAFAWKLKDEFFKTTNVVSDLKLRLGWGVTGQQDGIGYYTYLPVYGQSSPTAQYQFGNSFYSFLRPSAYDANIKWETTTTTNLGLDFGFLKNRITGTVDFYQKKTKDLLSVIPVAPGSNFDITLLTNVGNLENKGVELTINTNPIRKKDFNWDLGFNLTYNKTEITNLLKQQDKNFQGIDVSGISGGTGNNIGKFALGYAPYVYNVFKQVYDANGKAIEGMYEDLNRDGRIDDADRYLYKKPAADFMFGLNTSVTYKKFSLGITGHGMLGNYLYNNFNSSNSVLRTIKNPIQFIGNASSNYLTTQFSNNQYLSDYYIENASFFRLDNINFGYNFGSVLKNKAQLRLTANIQNVFVITKYSGADPENASSTGVDNNIYPRPTIYSIGANLDF
jgi:iron complex outermembrane receptor protein